MLVVLGGFGLVAAILVPIGLTTSDRALEAFLALWVAGVAWTAYWGVFAFAYEVALAANGTLRWCSISGCHEVPFSAIRGISTPWGLFGAGLRRLRIAGGRSPLLIASAPGFGDVMAMIEQVRPDLAVRGAWYDRLTARVGKSGMRWRRL